MVLWCGKCCRRGGRAIYCLGVWERLCRSQLGEDGNNFLKEVASRVNIGGKIGILKAKKREENFG